MKRILQLDFFRGLLLVVMTAHHFMSGNNIFNRLTNESFAWVSAGEGFFFLSGLTAGIVYGQLYINKGSKALLKATTKRLRRIYIYHVAVLLLILFSIYSFDYMYAGWHQGMPNFGQSKMSVFLQVPFFLYLPPFLDLLPVYVLFFAILPFAVNSYVNGKAWHVLLPSVLIYIFGFFYIEYNSSFMAFKKAHMPHVLNPFCWQFLFLFGVYSGHLFLKGTLQKLIEKKILFFSALIVSIAFCVMKVCRIDIGFNISYWTDGGSLGLLRILNFVSLSLCIAYLCKKHRSWFTFKPLCFLGKYSLEVFTLHVVLVYFLRPILPHLNTFSYAYKNTRLYPLETLLLILVLLSLFLAPYLFLKRSFSKVGLQRAFNQISFFKL